MKTKEFLKVLKENLSKELLFEYRSNEFVGANYHITEVKNTSIHSVDCGGNSDAWNETIVQLWESPKEVGKRDFMQADKALSILEKVSKIHPLDQNAITKFEYSNANFHKANLEINNIEVTLDKVLIKLFVPFTDCKAKDECGIPETVLTETVSGSCKPNSGCC